MATVWIPPSLFAGSVTSSVEMALRGGVTLSSFQTMPGVYSGLTEMQADDAKKQFPGWVVDKPTYGANAVALAASSHWNLDDAGGNIADIAGGITGVGTGTANMIRQTPSIMPTGEGLSTQWATGTAGTYFECGDVYDFPGTTSYTFAGWFSCTDYSILRYGQGKGQSSPAERHFMLNIGNGTGRPGVSRISVAATAAITTPTPSAVPQGVPFHWAVTFDGTTMRAYLNSILIATNSNGGTVSLMDNTATFPFRIGGPGHSVNACWHGYQQNVSVWNGAVLSDDQIESLWRAS